MKLFLESLLMATLALSVLIYGCTKPAPEVKEDKVTSSSPSSTPVAASTSQPAGTPKPTPVPEKKQDKKPDPNGK